MIYKYRPLGEGIYHNLRNYYAIYSAWQTQLLTYLLQGLLL